MLSIYFILTGVCIVAAQASALQRCARNGKPLRQASEVAQSQKSSSFTVATRPWQLLSGLAQSSDVHVPSGTYHAVRATAQDMDQFFGIVFAVNARLQSLESLEIRPTSHPRSCQHRLRVAILEHVLDMLALAMEDVHVDGGMVALEEDIARALAMVKAWKIALQPGPSKLNTPGGFGRVQIFLPALFKARLTCTAPYPYISYNEQCTLRPEDGACCPKQPSEPIAPIGPSRRQHPAGNSCESYPLVNFRAEREYPRGLPPLRPRQRLRLDVIFATCLALTITAWTTVGRDQLATLSSLMQVSRAGPVAVSFSPILPFYNVAQKSLGASIAPELTSPTYDLSAFALYERMIYKLSGYDFRHTTQRLLPICLISGICAEPGVCWQLASDTGHVGIRLRRPVVVSAISMYQPSHRLLDADGPASPKRLRAWALVDGTAIEGMRGLVTENIGHFLQQTSNYTDHNPGRYSGLGESHFLLVGEWENPLRLESGYALFYVSQFVPKIAADLIVIEVQSNWDAQRNTCLYALGVHELRP
ncbi:hypothetical protein FB107DRAFT_252643 [Schizophyllum commune]